MQSVRWMSFCLSNAITRTVVHFFPSSGNVTAPYAAVCKLTLFGRGIERKSVNLEGARLSQPDGVRLDAVFPKLNDGASGIFGLEVEVGTTQNRVDMDASSCVIELISAGHSVRFWPCSYEFSAEAPPNEEEQNAKTPASALAIKDAFTTTSLIAVNAGSETFSPRLSRMHLNGGLHEPAPMPSISLSPGSAEEITLGEEPFVATTPQECSWGLVRMGNVLVTPPPPSVALFQIFRDAHTKRPVSVRVL